MGAEARCRATIDGRAASGKALLETREAIFSGEGLRAVVKLADLVEVAARDGVLELRTRQAVLRLELGDAADKWLKKIKNPPSRTDKLGVKPGMRVALLGVPDPTLPDEIRARGAAVARSARGVDLVLYGVETSAALGKLAALRDAIRDGGAIWVVRRKGGKGVTERESMAAGKAAGLVDVKVCALSDELTAEKYVRRRAT
jgi:hypothetical protein